MPEVRIFNFEVSDKRIYEDTIAEFIGTRKVLGFSSSTIPVGSRMWVTVVVCVER